MNIIFVDVAPYAGISATDWKLANWDENDVIRFDGGSYYDYIWGSIANDIIYGYDSKDTLVGHDGDDLIDGGPGDDFIYGEYAGYGVYSGTGNDTLKGGDGNDQIEGGAGFDRLFGGSGDDLLSADRWETDPLTDSGGFISGGAGNDTLKGGIGIDEMQGDEGNDILGEGIEYWSALRAGDWGGDIIKGGDGNDQITSFGAGDRIGGGVGRDVLTLYSGYSTADLVIDISSGGGNADIGDGTRIRGIEKLTAVVGSGNDRVTGWFLQDSLGGGAGDDYIDGGKGDDIVSGGEGEDTLIGGMGNDMVSGGTGQDILTGGEGADDFIFRKESLGGPSDDITDFEQGSDVINLSIVEANINVQRTLTFLGQDEFSGTRMELRYHNPGNGKTVVEVDVDGDAVADLTINLTGTFTLTANDFVL